MLLTARPMAHVLFASRLREMNRPVIRVLGLSINTKGVFFFIRRFKRLSYLKLG